MKTEHEFLTDNGGKWSYSALEVHEMLGEFADQFKPKWIPVEERLPGYNQRVLAFTPDTDNTREDTRIIIYGSIPSGFPSGVTHWMPLPTKP